MAQPTSSEGPRTTVPQPYGAKDSELIREMAEKLKELQAENAVLGAALQEQQASSSFSQGQLVSSLKAREAEVAELTQQLEAAKKEASHHRAQLEAQHRDIGSYSRAVDRWRGAQSELEELVAELHERCAAQEAELAAAGAELERLREQQVAAVKLPAPCSAAPSAERLEAEMIEGQLAAMGRLHAQQVAAAAAERQVLADQLRALQGQHASLQLEQQAARDKAAAEIASAQGLAEQSRLALERCMADKSALAAALEAGRGMEAVHRQQSAEAGSRVVALRAELVANSEALHTALASNAALQERNTQLSEELAAADRLVQALRGEISSLRKSLLQAQTASTAQLLAQATQEGQAYVSLAKTLPKPASQLPAAILRYIQVLQYALAEADKRHQALAAAAEQASELEAAVRMQLAASQDAQLAASRALTAQVRRVHSLESMRLGDVRELAAMERQLAAVTQEAWQLREQLVKTSLRTTSADS